MQCLICSCMCAVAALLPLLQCIQTWVPRSDCKCTAPWHPVGLFHGPCGLCDPEIKHELLTRPHEQQCASWRSAECLAEQNSAVLCCAVMPSQTASHSQCSRWCMQRLAGAGRQACARYLRGTKSRLAYAHQQGTKVLAHPAAPPLPPRQRAHPLAYTHPAACMCRG